MERAIRPTEMSGPVRVVTFKGGPKYSGRTQPKWSVPSGLQPKFPEFWLNEVRAPTCVNMILLDKRK